jgi:hypothetical protein
MRVVLGWLMALNMALFIFGAVQHVGLEIGPFSEPVIVPAAIVESICALSLLWSRSPVYSLAPSRSPPVEDRALSVTIISTEPCLH